MARVRRKTIAQALNVDAAVITRNAKDGMPTTSVEAARAWREQHVRPRSPTPPSDPPARPGPLLAVVAELGDSTAPGEIEELRAALAMLPPEMRGRVRLSVATWKLLLGRDVLAALAAEAPADPADPDDDVGAVLYLAALGPYRHA